MENRRCVNCMEEITGDVCPHCGYKEGDTEQTGYSLKRNSILHGRYLIGNVLGQGGFGITYIGYDIAFEIKVAIKEYFPMGYVSRDYTQSNQIVWNTMREGQEQWKRGNESFLKEARKMAKLDVFPEIVRVRDIFMENNTSYIVMDYVEGETLKAWLLKNGTMKFSDCVQMLSPLMQSLNRVHTRGLIHRDISPDNIMVLPSGEVRLLDLGAAKDLSIESNGTSQLVTKKGFSPSEQYMENGNIGTWTDVYALSATIYYCIVGKTAPEAMERLMGDKLTFDVPLTEALSGKAVKTLQEGLAIKPEDRIQTVEELEQRLQKAIQPEREQKKRKRKESEKQKEAVQKAEPASDSEEKEKTEPEQSKEKAEPEAVREQNIEKVTQVSDNHVTTGAAARKSKHISRLFLSGVLICILSFLGFFCFCLVEEIDIIDGLIYSLFYSLPFSVCAILWMKKRADSNIFVTFILSIGWGAVGYLIWFVIADTVWNVLYYEFDYNLNNGYIMPCIVAGIVLVLLHFIQKLLLKAVGKLRSKKKNGKDSSS